MKNIIDKLKELATNKNVSIAEIRNCIGNDRFYRIADGKSDLPLGKLIKLSKILNLNDTEKLWLINKKKRKIRYPEAFERKTPSYSPIGMRRFYTRQLPDTGVLKIRIPYRPVAGYRPLRISAFKDYPQIIFNPPSGMAVLPV